MIPFREIKARWTEAQVKDRGNELWKYHLVPCKHFENLLFIHLLTRSFIYSLIASYVSDIELVAGNIAHRNMTQTSKFTVQLSEAYWMLLK